MLPPALIRPGKACKGVPEMAIKGQKSLPGLKGRKKLYLFISGWCRPFQTNSPFRRAAFADFHRPVDSPRRRPPF